MQLLLALSPTSRSLGLRRAHRRMATSASLSVHTYMHRCALGRNQMTHSGGRFFSFHIHPSRCPHTCTRRRVSGSPPAVSFLSAPLEGGGGGGGGLTSHIASAAAELQVSTSGRGCSRRAEGLPEPVKVKLLSEPLRTQRHPRARM